MSASAHGTLSACRHVSQFFLFLDSGGETTHTHHRNLYSEYIIPTYEKHQHNVHSTIVYVYLPGIPVVYRADAPSKFFLVWLWCGLHTEVGRYFGPTRNRLTDLGCDLEIVCNEAGLSRGRGPGTHTAVVVIR